MKRFLAACILGATGCTAVGPDYVEPEFDLPDAFDSSVIVSESSVELADWWQLFDDPVLVTVVERALSENLDLAAALARVEQARALRSTEISARYPNLNAVGSARRVETSNNVGTSFGSGFGFTIENYQVGLEAGWELDLWGRVRRSIEAAQGELDASAEDARAVLVALAASVGQAYVDLRGFEARLAIAQQNVAAQEQTLALVTARNQTGLVGELDVVRARASLEETRASIPSFERGAEAARDRLAVLAGQTPGSLDGELAASGPVPNGAAQIASGAPAELLRRRPDVRAAERRLAAATARVGVATAELYPQFQLTGAIGFEASDVENLLEHDATTFSIGPSLRWNLFDKNRLRALVGFQEAVVDEQLLAYRSTVLLAIEEVEGALEAIGAEQRRLTSLRSATADFRRALELSRDQYRQGLIDFQPVLDAQRSLFAAEDALETSKITIASSTIDLYRALGGGWEPKRLALSRATAND